MANRKPMNNTVTTKGNQTTTAKSPVKEQKISENVSTVKADEKEVKETVTKVEDNKVEASAVVKAVAENAEPKKRGRKPAAKKTETVKAAEETETAKKAKKTVSSAKKKEELTPEVYLQYCGEESDQNVIIEKIKE